MSYKLGQYTFRPIAVGTILGMAEAAIHFKQDYDHGESTTYAAGKAIVKFGLAQVAPWVGWANTAYLTAKGLSKTLSVAGRQLSTLNGAAASSFGQTYKDSAPAATMRQLSKAVIANNQMNVRYIYGQEARLMNRG